MTLAIIRAYHPADREKVLSLLQELNRHEAGAGAQRRTDLAGAIACLDDDSARAVAGGGQLVLEQDGQVLGYLAYEWAVQRPYFPLTDRPTLHIENIVVTKASRGQGHGRRLLAEAEAIARSNGALAISLVAVIGNHTAVRVYEAAGFSPTSMEMVKALDAPAR